MNYLAHLYLSGDDPGVLVGNFIGDYVKGGRFNRYNGSVQTGILLHRQIDSFTDRHPAFRESASLFKEGYQRYAGVVCDVVYDHLLAAGWEKFSDLTLNAFVSKSHRILMQHYFGLPLKVKQFLPFLIKSRRLENYRHLEGIEKTLNIMSANSSLPDKTAFAVKRIQTHYDILRDQFEVFMPEVISLSKAFLVFPKQFVRFNHPVVP
jgi:acyl carrier protein phosphodiesterase